MSLAATYWLNNWSSDSKNFNVNVSSLDSGLLGVSGD